MMMKIAINPKPGIAKAQPALLDLVSLEAMA
jgi:hypothetical protein